MTWSPGRTATVESLFVELLQLEMTQEMLTPPPLPLLAFLPSCLPVAKKIDELQEILRKKDKDMKQMEQRYKRYMDKARTVWNFFQWILDLRTTCLMSNIVCKQNLGRKYFLKCPPPPPPKKNVRSFQPALHFVCVPIGDRDPGSKATACDRDS